MSSNIIYFVPEDPFLTLGKDELNEALAYARMAFPRWEIITYEVTSFIWHVPHFLDAGENFESVRCPACHEDLLDWWKGAMDRWWDGDRTRLEAVMPCCGLGSDLNSLAYDWPQGFARCGVKIKDPHRTATVSDRETMEGITGTPLRVIRTRY